MIMFKDTLQYLKKSFRVLFLVTVLPAVIMSFFVKPFSNITFLPMLFVGKTDYNFKEIISMMLTPIEHASAWAGIIGYVLFFVLLWIGIVAGTCIIEKHFKTGELSLKLSLHQIMPFLLPALFVIALWLFIYLIACVAQSGLISLIHYICGVTPPSAVDCILSTLISLLLFSLVMYFTIHITFLPLIIVYYGYGLRESFVESIRLTSKNFKSLICGFIIPLLIIIVANIILTSITTVLTEFAGMSESAHYWIDYCISVISYVFSLTYIIAYNIVTFYKLSNLERRDIKRY